MKTQFDKIYVISLCSNIDKQKHMKYILNDYLNLDFEFIYGPNLFNLSNFECIKLQDTGLDNHNENHQGRYINLLGTALGHLTAIYNAYSNKYNNCLIFEDDVMCLKDKDYIFECFNNMPEDADIIKFGYLGWNNYPKYYNEYYSVRKPVAGAQCWSINNYATIEKIIQKQYNHSLFNIDSCSGKYDEFKIYTSNIRLFIDPYYALYENPQGWGAIDEQPNIDNYI